MSQRVAPAPFLTKTYQLVDDGRTNDVVSWSSTGTTFVVWKMDEFARDLLPTYFKHNNFSSFVRQLNTYGFRKIVPDKWEFANDYFRRGHKDLLSTIRRREHVSPAPSKTHPDEKPNGGDEDSSPSTSTDTKNAGSVETETTGRYEDLFGENEKLRKDNESLRSELERTKRRCEDMVGFLTRCLKVGPDQIDRIMRQGTCGPSRDDGVEKERGNGNGNGGDEESVKLFGVLVKKRGREENMGCGGPHPKEMIVDFNGGRWMKSSKVCN